jgi:UDPglucose 6-dehydrogenase
MKISIVGTGYVGLVTGTCFAETGVDVTCVDIDQQKIDNLKKGIIPIYEPGLDILVVNNYEKKRLSFTTSIKESLEHTDIVFIAVGTPPGEDGSADLKYVLEVARQIGQNMDNYLVVVTKSTVPVGTSHKVKAAITEELEKRGVEIPFDITSNPEFLKEGNAVEDFMKPDRIVVGVESERAEKLMQKLYKPFVLNGHPILFMDIPSSELTKYAANSMLATKISFINDIANLCELVGADINMVRKGIGSDSRIGNKFIYAGIGYGGSCFPKDVKALIKTAEENDYSLRLLKSVDEINNSQKLVLVEKVRKYFKNNLKDKNIAIWGLSYKPNTDDMRESPSVVIINQLLNDGAKITVYDPVAIDEGKKIFGNKIKFGKDSYDILIDADALLLLTEWTEFRIPNFKVMEKLMREKVIFDGRNIYDPIEIKENGFKYFGIGRNV